MRTTLDLSQAHPAIRDKIATYKAEVIQSVKELVDRHDVVIVGMGINPFPLRARRLLDAQNVRYEYVAFGSYFSQWRTRLALKLWTGWPTFPMVFVKGSLVGGYSDLKRLVENGELSALLRAPR